VVVGLTWTSYQTQMATLAVTSVTDPNFVSILSAMIDNAELRICQDLDLLSNQQTSTTFACVTGASSLTIPVDSNGQPPFVTIENVNVITPAGTSNPDLGTRNPCLPASKEVIQNLWPSSAGAGVPNKFAVLGQFSLLFGPWPAQNYSLEIIGTTRPASLSAANPTTFISLNLPHIFIAASMVYISGYQRNFGRGSDDPQMSVSWESYYKTMLGSSSVEEARKKWEGPAWTSKSPATFATPTRSPAPPAA
jgi:hypothetical protein